MSLPQREGREALSIAPEDSIPNTAAWVDQYNDPMNDRNKPVPERKGGPDPNGWVNEAFDTNQTEEV